MTAHGPRCECERCFARARSINSNRLASPTSAVKGPGAAVGSGGAMEVQALDVGRCLTKPAKGEIEELLKAWRTGDKIPHPLPHNPVPDDALESVHQVAEFFLAVRGLRHGELIDAPVM